MEDDLKNNSFQYFLIIQQLENLLVILDFQNIMYI